MVTLLDEGEDHARSGSRSTSFIACGHGTSGSAIPCRMWTGQPGSIGPPSIRWRRPSSMSARVTGVGSGEYCDPRCHTPSRITCRRISSGNCCHISTSVKSVAGAISTRPAGLAFAAASSAIQPPIDDPTRIGRRGARAAMTVSASASQSEIVQSAKVPSDSPWPV